MQHWGKYPVDLAIVLDSREIYFVNFAGQIAHGCRTGLCPHLKRYVGDKSLPQLLAEAQERDGYIQGWVEENKTQEGCAVPTMFTVAAITK